LKKFFKVLFNIFWVIIIGLSSAISSAIMGVLCCITIVGIPLGLQHFKFIKLAFAPAGRAVVTNFNKHPIMNVLWLIFGGLILSILYYLIGVICCISIIGIPLGLQLFKIAKFNLGPFGAEIVWEGNFTNDKNTLYDYDLLFKKVATNYDMVVSNNGKLCSVADYVVDKSYLIQEEKPLKNIKTKIQGYYFSVLATIFVVALTLIEIFSSSTIVMLVVPAFATLIGLVTLMILQYHLADKKLLKLYSNNFNNLFNYYTNESPVNKQIKKTSFQYVCENLPYEIFKPNEIKYIQENIDKISKPTNSSVRKHKLKDYATLSNKIFNNTHKIITTPTGETHTTLGYLRSNKSLLENESKHVLMPISTFITLGIISVAFILLAFLCIKLEGNTKLYTLYYLISASGIIVFACFLFLLVKFFIDRISLKKTYKQLDFLFDYYPIANSLNSENNLPKQNPNDPQEMVYMYFNLVVATKNVLECSKILEERKSLNLYTNNIAPTYINSIPQQENLSQTVSNEPPQENTVKTVQAVATPSSTIVEQPTQEEIPTDFNYVQLLYQINENPNKLVKTPTGEEKTAGRFIKESTHLLDEEKRINTSTPLAKKLAKIILFVSLGLMGLLITIFNLLPESIISNNTLENTFIIIFNILLATIAGSGIALKIFNKKYNRTKILENFYIKNLYFLSKYYDYTDPKKEFASSTEIQNAGGILNYMALTLLDEPTPTTKTTPQEKSISSTTDTTTPTDK